MEGQILEVPSYSRVEDVLLTTRGLDTWMYSSEFVFRPRTYECSSATRWRTKYPLLFEEAKNQARRTPRS
jgi:hypothetical protein